MSADAHSAETSGEEKPKKKSKKLILIGLGVVGLLAGGGVPLLLMSTKEPPKEEEAHAVDEEPKEPEKQIEVADLGQFIVNLSENSSFIKIRILLEYDVAIIEKQLSHAHGGEGGGEANGGGASGGSGGAEKPAGPHPHITKSENRLRDAVIRILSSKRTAELLTPEGKTRLKEELIDGLNEAMGLERPPIVGVLFTEFIIQ
jgi:flagellar FliL protein